MCLMFKILSSCKNQHMKSLNNPFQENRNIYLSQGDLYLDFFVIFKNLWTWLPNLKSQLKESTWEEFSETLTLINQELLSLMNSTPLQIKLAKLALNPYSFYQIPYWFNYWISIYNSSMCTNYLINIDYVGISSYYYL